MAAAMTAATVLELVGMLDAKRPLLLLLFLGNDEARESRLPQSDSLYLLTSCIAAAMDILKCDLDLERLALAMELAELRDELLPLLS
jgi:hypothetical protein